jgi:hypothetical protein
MKSYLFLFLVFFSLHVNSQEIHPQLIGIWQAELVDSKTDTYYFILEKRFANGQFESLLIIESSEGIENYGGSGKWWVEENQIIQEYNSENPEESVIQIMSFEILSETEVNLKTKSKDRPKILRDFIQTK